MMDMGSLIGEPPVDMWPRKCYAPLWKSWVTNDSLLNMEIPSNPCREIAICSSTRPPPSPDSNDAAKKTTTTKNGKEAGEAGQGA